MGYAYRKPLTLPLSLLIFIFSVSLSLLLSCTTFAADYAFPIIGKSSFSNDYEAPRASGPHHAIDIIAKKHQKIVSRTNGVVTYVEYPQRGTQGYMVVIRADNGYRYYYIHLNNDTPGTDDGKGGGNRAFGPDIVPGKRVAKGQLLGYVGDSGNAEGTVSHLHFEVVKPNGDTTNPYNGLVNNSYRLSKPIMNYPIDDDEIIPASTSFTGGYSLSFGDIDGDNSDELIAGSGKGGRYLTVMEKNGSAINRFQPNGSTFLGGVDVASGDVDNDGDDEIITGAGPGGKYVKVFQSDGTQIAGINPYNSERGVTVGVGNFDGDNALEIITGLRKGGEPRVNIYNLDGSLISSRNVYASSFRGGVRVDGGNVDVSSPVHELATTSQQDGSSRVRLATPSDFSYSEYFGEEWLTSYYDIAVSDEGDVYASMGTNRRSTIRPVSGL